MSGEVRLGVRLARGSLPTERLRATATVLAHLVGVWIMLNVLAAVRAEIALPSYDGDGLPLLVLTVVATVAVPVAVLLATVARLSAALRDRRLAGLRVLGLSPGRTRLVAAVETGTVAALGSVLGLLAFWITRPWVRGVDVAGRDWSSTSFTPWLAATAIAVLGLPLVTLAVALVPSARPASTLTHAATLAPQRTPSLWRLALLPAGLVLAGGSTMGAEAGGGLDFGRFAVLVAGGVASALGLVLIIPVFTRLIADCIVRVPGHPSLRIAGRRLQTQPAGVSRIVAGLLVALFVVAGSRMVLAAFESTPQYRAADRAAGDGPVAYDVVVRDATDVTTLADRLTSVDGVIAAYPMWQVMTGCDVDDPCLSAFVGTCADVEAAVPDAVGCRDDQVAWLDRAADPPTALGATTTWSSGEQDAAAKPVGPTVELRTPGPERRITSGTADYAVGDAMQAQVFIPTSTPGVMAVVDQPAGDRLVPVTAQVDPRVLDQAGLESAAASAAPLVEVYDPWADDSYDFVVGLRALTWAVAALVLSIGLVGFAIATIDRAVSRRAEMVSLQLVGTGRGVIRAAQWWEAAVPLVVGVVAAIAAGLSIGFVYLSLTGETSNVPWASIGLLTVVSAGAAIVVAGLTVVAGAPRIRAELIRRA